MGFFNDIFSGITNATKAASRAASGINDDYRTSRVSAPAPVAGGGDRAPSTGSYNAAPKPGGGDRAPSMGSYGPSQPVGANEFLPYPVVAGTSTPAPISTSPTGQSNSGTTNPGGNSGGGGGVPAPQSPAPKPAPPPPPPPPPKPKRPDAAEMPAPTEWEVLTIPDAESNAQYVSQMAALQKVLDDYAVQDQTARESRLGTGVGKKIGSVNQSLMDLGWIDPDLFQGDEKGHWDERGRGSFGRSMVTNEGDFAGRGAMDSGEYLKSVQNINSDYNDRLNAINTEQNDWSTAQDIAKQSKTDEVQGQRGVVKANTVADIAKSLGVDADMVLSGFGHGGAKYRRRIDKGATDKERDYERTTESANQINNRAKTRANEKRKAAQRLINGKYADQIAEWEKKYA